ncbi:FAD-dependent oxidoreductase [Streptomyces sp. L7]
MNTTALPAHTEVAIVGAGPTGLALAVTLASAGIDFVVLDRLAEGRTPRVPPLYTPAPWKSWTSWGASDQLIARGVQVTRFAVRDGSRRLLTVPFDKLPTPHPYTLMVPQYRDRERAAGPAARARR